MFSALLTLLPLLSFPLVLASPLAAPSPAPSLLPRWATIDQQYGGKVLTVNNYTVIPNIFIQDSPTFNATGYNTLNDSFGLIDKSAQRWKKFTDYITKLNKEADEYTTYKVIYIARHGEGFHNVAESYYGTPAWNCYWSLQNTDGNITWGPDAQLTPKGIADTKAVNVAWKEQIKAGIPLPQTLYTSPMRRAASTAEITWSDILFNQGNVPYVKEQLRESIGLHTCDKRSNRTLLANKYSCYHFDRSFTEHDEQWNEIYQETSQQQTLRLRLFMNELFAEDPSTFISITAHSGVISSFFRAIGHQVFSVQTAGLVPVVVKAVAYPSATMPVITGGQSATAPVCTANPTTKVSAPATVTVQPTWYPACAATTAASSTATGCLASPVTMTGPSKSA